MALVICRRDDAEYTKDVGLDVQQLDILSDTPRLRIALDPV